MVVSMTFHIEKALQQMGVKMTRRIPIGVARGINKTADSEKVAMGRAVAGDMGLRVGKVKDAIRVKKATPQRLTAQVIATGKQIPLIEFSGRGPEPSRGQGRGVSYRLPGGKGRLPHAFIATMPTGHRGIFERNAGGRRRGPRPMRSQLPIHEKFGPSIAHVFGKMIPVGEARREAVLLKNVQHEIEFALAG